MRFNAVFGASVRPGTRTFEWITGGLSNSGETLQMAPVLPLPRHPKKTTEMITSIGWPCLPHQVPPRPEPVFPPEPPIMAFPAARMILTGTAFPICWSMPWAQIL